MSIFVIDVATIAFTLKAARYVHANAVLAHLWHESAFVDFLGDTSHRIDDGARSIAAEL